MESFRIANRVVDPSLNRITVADGTTVQVEPKVMSVLVVLAERPSEVVTREELLARVWNGVFVTDDALHRTIRELRRLFDDDAEAPRVIETIRKRGYRLIVPVEAAAKGARVGDSPRDWPRDWHRDRPRARHGASPLIAGAVLLLAIAAITRFTLWGDAHRARPLAVVFTPFTSDPGNEVDPALSASGKLAYVARGSDGRAHIFIKRTTDAAAVQATRGAAAEYAPTWSPDEQQLAFVQTDDSGCRIMITNLGGGHAREISPCLSRQEFKMSWSPDGRHLAVTAGDGRLSSPSHIEIIDIADGSHRAATEPPMLHAGDYAPAFSPDGREIAFVRVVSGGITSLCVVHRDRSDSVTVLTEDSADVLGVDWAPSGDKLIFSSDRAGAISIWRIDAHPKSADTEPELVAGGGNKLKHPSVARRTGEVAYEDWQYEINLRDRATGAADSDDSAAPINPTADRWNFHPQISPDGRWIAFQSTRSGSYEIWISDRHGNDARQLTQSRIYKSMARWSPDSRSLAFTVRTTSTEMDLVVVDVESGQARRIARGRSLMAPSWSHDGASVRIGGLIGNDHARDDEIAEPTIWDVSVHTGEVRGFARGSAAIASLDGQVFYTTDLGSAGLHRRTQGNAESTVVVNRVSADQWPNWGVYDRGVYYVGYPDTGEPQLFMIENGSTIERPMTRLPSMAWPGVAVSRDGSRVIYAHADRRAANIGGLILR
jgi:Tol biopolymer transport system component/DNA-binding winged helix-turn-helix (wHTH) protein